MVEFPLLSGEARRVYAAGSKSIPDSGGLLTLIARHQSRPSDPACMWETNTFPASFHARLNVAAGLSLPCAAEGGAPLRRAHHRSCRRGEWYVRHPTRGTPTASLTLRCP